MWADKVLEVQLGRANGAGMAISQAVICESCTRFRSTNRVCPLLVPEEPMRIARILNAGFGRARRFRPSGTVEGPFLGRRIGRKPFSRPGGADGVCSLKPAFENAGWFRSPLRGCKGVGPT
jgi:hypothetical protein